MKFYQISNAFLLLQRELAQTRLSKLLIRPLPIDSSHIGLFISFVITNKKLLAKTNKIKVFAQI